MGCARRLSVSIQISRGIKSGGVPWGRRWLSRWLKFLRKPRIVVPSQKGMARLRVKDRWLVGVNEFGISPIRLTERRIINSEKIGAAQGALLGPAARRITGGSCVANDCQAKKIREVNQLGDFKRVIQDGAVIRARVIIGMIIIGGSNWSNSLRFKVIEGLSGWCAREGRERAREEVEVRP